MSEMVERAARALLRSKRNGPPESYPPGYVDAQVERYWPQFADDARTVIAAMREPTKEMIAAAAAHGTGGIAPPLGGWYTAMIDEALK